jgi:ketosteroid isomerase-like protein
MPFRFAAVLFAAFLLRAETAPVVPDIGAIWATDWSAKRLDHILTLYASDALFFTTEGGRFTGAPAIRDLFQKVLATNDPTIHMHRLNTERSG